ncbi:MAG: tetratricopeptide repeat protein [Deltaproteobacteria bacterium]|nr:tetratricopeptide repeat protein [Deltaproteobacteria bacterium]
MEILSRLPVTHENKQEKIALVLSIAPPLHRVGYSKDYLPMLQQAEALAEELGEEKKRVHIRSLIGVYYVGTGGDPQLGWKYLEECMNHPDMEGNAELAVPVAFNTISSFSVSGDFLKTCRIAPTVIGLIERSGTRNRSFGTPHNVYAFMFAVWGIATSATGNFDRGEELLEKALSFALDMDHQFTLGFVEWHYGMIYAIKGDGHRSAEHLRKAIRYMEDSQTVIHQGPVWSWLGLAHLFMGETEPALEFTRKGLQMHTDVGVLFFQSMCHWLLSQVHLELGDTENARAHAEMALKCSSNNNERYIQGISRIFLERALAKTEQKLAEAEQQILRGLEILEALGLRPFYSMGYLGLGEVYAEIGQKQDALSYVSCFSLNCPYTSILLLRPCGPETGGWYFRPGIWPDPAAVS